MTDAPGRRLGVGIVSCGEAAQAIHVPTLLRLRDRFQVIHCMDIDGDVAARLAARSTPNQALSLTLCWPNPDSTSWWSAAPTACVSSRLPLPAPRV